MTCSEKAFHRFGWLWTLFGLIFYIGDTGSDILLSVQFFGGGHIVWAALTLMFVVVSSACIQIFSYVWFKDDIKGVDDDDDDYEDDQNTKVPSTSYLIGIHLLQIGICTRYLHLLKRRFKVLRLGLSKNERLEISCLVADISMLRMFETFLESIPQLILQAYIILEHNHRSNLQYISMAMSFITIAWSTVDYRRSLRNSLPEVSEMQCGIPTAVYLAYKILTITPRILSLTLFIMLWIGTIPLMSLIWLAGFIWATVVETDFCTFRVQEYLYRAVVGAILIFTFFNIKGQNTIVPMTIYYMISVSQNLAAPILLFLLKPESERTDYLLPIGLFILFSNLMGLGYLGLYYYLLHPSKPGYKSTLNETDGPENKELGTIDEHRNKEADDVDGHLKNLDEVDGNLKNVDEVDGHMKKADEVNGHMKKADEVNGHMKKADEVNGHMKKADEVDGFTKKSDETNSSHISMPDRTDRSKVKNRRINRFMQL